MTSILYMHNMYSTYIIPPKHKKQIHMTSIPFMCVYTSISHIFYMYETHIFCTCITSILYKYDMYSTYIIPLKHKKQPLLCQLRCHR